MECDKKVINSQYKNYYIYVQTPDILSNGSFRAAYTVLDQDGQHLILNFVEDKHQKKACAKAFQKAKEFIDSLPKKNPKAYILGDNSTEMQPPKEILPMEKSFSAHQGSYVQK